MDELKILEEIWNRWLGSGDMLIGLERPTNFLGSTEKYKKSFLETAKIYLDEKSINDLKLKKEYDIIRRKYVSYNEKCDCSNGCEKCNDTKRIIKRKKK